mgnify:CR=1 FL=1
MNSSNQTRKDHVAIELKLAEQCYQSGQPQAAFTHLENAHVIGQSSTYLHVKAHVAMLIWGMRERNIKEALGQVVRIVGAATKTIFGLVPLGNTGGTNVSPFKPMPLSAEHTKILNNL